tara:strand:- start:3317 stop:4378 length:1062 start_codon:yes stop_codon:yes gene_type:complete
MKTNTFFKQTFLCIALGFMTLALSAQTTVNNNAGTAADFTSLQAAIDAATAGDVIYLQHSAVSYGTINITESVTIIGRSSGDGSFISEVGRINLTNGASNTTIKGLKINDIRETGSGFTITDVAFIDCSISAGIISLGLNNTFNNMLFQGNVIRGSITLRANTLNVLMTNNIILSTSVDLYMVDTLLFSNNIFGYFTGMTITNRTTSLLDISNSIFVASNNSNRTVNLNPLSGTIVVDNCISYNYGTDNYNFSTGAGITINANTQQNIDPLFTSVDKNNSNSIANASAANFDPVNDDLNLLGGSTFVDDGIYEGYNFKNFGTPNGYPSIKVLASSASVPKNGNLSVTIEAKTN